MTVVKCNMCDREWYEEELEIVKGENDGDHYPACPVCKTDAYLQDMEV